MPYLPFCDICGEPLPEGLSYTATLTTPIHVLTLQLSRVDGSRPLLCDKDFKRLVKDLAALARTV